MVMELEGKVVAVGWKSRKPPRRRAAAAASASMFGFWILCVGLCVVCGVANAAALLT
jgi:hypothetical protein